MDLVRLGLYPILQVFTNNTVLIQIDNNVQERVNVRHLIPHRRFSNEYYARQQVLQAAVAARTTRNAPP